MTEDDENRRSSGFTGPRRAGALLWLRNPSYPAACLQVFQQPQLHTRSMQVKARRLCEVTECVGKEQATATPRTLQRVPLWIGCRDVARLQVIYLHHMHILSRDSSGHPFGEKPACSIMCSAVRWTRFYRHNAACSRVPLQAWRTI